MTKPVSFTLGENELAFLSSMVEKGRFGNRTEVVRAGLRLLEDYETHQKAKRLHMLIQEGERDLAENRINSYETPDQLAQAILRQNET